MNYFDEEDYYRGDFKEEIDFIAKLLDINPKRINIDPYNTCGEFVIFIDEHYNGYLDNQFYDYMLHGLDEYGEYEDWVKMWEERSK